MIRLAIEADIPRLVEMGQRFRTYTPYSEHVGENVAQMTALGKKLLTIDGLLVAEQSGTVTGMLGFVVFEHFISGEIVAGEIFWWVDPEYRGAGLRLLKEAEKLAKARGALRMQMIAPNDQVATVYQRLGYNFVETAYQKSL